MLALVQLKCINMSHYLPIAMRVFWRALAALIGGSFLVGAIWTSNNNAIAALQTRADNVDNKMAAMDTLKEDVAEIKGEVKAIAKFLGVRRKQ